MFGTGSRFPKEGNDNKKQKYTPEIVPGRISETLVNEYNIQLTNAFITGAGRKYLS